MNSCIFHGNFFQNWFPGSAHSLRVGFLAVTPKLALPGPRAVASCGRACRAGGKICAESRCTFLLKFQLKTRKILEFNRDNANIHGQLHS